MINPKAKCDSYWVRIYIAGKYDFIEEVCRQYCESGYCVNIAPVNYIYKHGEQSGARIELINYARFPENRDEMFQRANILALDIAYRCHQKSWSIVTPTDSYYYER